MTMQETALALHKKGYTPLRLEPLSKAPRYIGWQSKKVTVETIRRDFALPGNLGLRTGDEHDDGTCLITIDVDRDDPELIRVVERSLGISVPTKRGRKGASFIFRIDRPIKTHKIYWYDRGDGTKKTAVIDVLCQGAQTVIPPSIHPDTKSEYLWIAGRPIWELDYRELPVFGPSVIDEIRGFCKKADDPIVALSDMEWKGVGGGGNTHDTCVAAIASMVARQWTDEEMHERIQRGKREAAEASGLPYNWPEAERTIQGWIDTAREKGFANKKLKAKPSHGDLANLVLAKHGAFIRRDKVRRDWGVYNGKFWEESATEEIKTLVRQSLTDDQVFRSTIDGVEAVMRYDRSIAVGADTWDAHKHYLNCPDGTYDLKTRERLDHDPAHFITRMTRVSPRFDYQDSLWLRALNMWFGSDAVEIHYVQTLFGLFLTGETRDECVAMWIGRSRAGKTKMTEIIGYVMGDYAQTATDTAFLDVRYHPHQEEVARMRGKRLVFVHEVEGYLNLRRVKSIASGEAISASFKGKDSFEYKPEAKIWFVGNEAPPTHSSAGELQRRLHVYEFERQIDPKDVDLDLSAKLRDEAEYVLGWAIDGARMYYAGGLHRSPHVIESGRRYFSDADIIEQWIEENCVVDAGAVEMVVVLFENFSSWGGMAGVRAMPDKGRFSQRLKAKGYKLDRKTMTPGKAAVRVIAGLRLKTNEELPLQGIVFEGEKF
jgi:putative DNA primase/helicase